MAGGGGASCCCMPCCGWSWCCSDPAGPPSKPGGGGGGGMEGPTPGLPAAPTAAMALLISSRLSCCGTPPAPATPASTERQRTENRNGRGCDQQVSATQSAESYAIQRVREVRGLGGDPATSLFAPGPCTASLSRQARPGRTSNAPSRRIFQFEEAGKAGASVLALRRRRSLAGCCRRRRTNNAHR